MAWLARNSRQPAPLSKRAAAWHGTLGSPSWLSLSGAGLCSQASTRQARTQARAQERCAVALYPLRSPKTTPNPGRNHVLSLHADPAGPDLVSEEEGHEDTLLHCCPKMGHTGPFAGPCPRPGQSPGPLPRVPRLLSTPSCALYHLKGPTLASGSAWRPGAHGRLRAREPQSPPCSLPFISSHCS